MPLPQSGVKIFNKAIEILNQPGFNLASDPNLQRDIRTGELSLIGVICEASGLGEWVEVKRNHYSNLNYLVYIERGDLESLDLEPPARADTMHYQIPHFVAAEVGLGRACQLSTAIINDVLGTEAFNTLYSPLISMSLAHNLFPNPKLLARFLQAHIAYRGELPAKASKLLEPLERALGSFLLD